MRGAYSRPSPSGSGRGDRARPSSDIPALPTRTRRAGTVSPSPDCRAPATTAAASPRTPRSRLHRRRSCDRRGRRGGAPPTMRYCPHTGWASTNREPSASQESCVDSEVGVARSAPSAFSDGGEAPRLRLRRAQACRIRRRSPRSTRDRDPALRPARPDGSRPRSARPCTPPGSPSSGRKDRRCQATRCACRPHPPHPTTSAATQSVAALRSLTGAAPHSGRATARTGPTRRTSQLRS